MQVLTTALPELCLAALQVLETALETAATPVPAASDTRPALGGGGGGSGGGGSSGGGGVGGGDGGGDDDDDDCDIILAAARSEWTSALVRQLQQPCWRTPNAAGGGSALQDRLSRLHTCSVGAQDGAAGAPMLLSILVRCWGRSERLLLESALTSSGDAVRKDTALRHAASAWSAATGEHQYTAGVDRKQQPGAPSLAERQARRCVPAWFARHFLRPLQGADEQLERKIVQDFVQPRLEELERIWWVAFIEGSSVPLSCACMCSPRRPLPYPQVGRLHRAARAPNAAADAHAGAARARETASGGPRAALAAAADARARAGRVSRGDSL